MKIESYKQGTPCWAELSTNDMAYAKDFYSGLFGWTYEDHQTVTGQVYTLAMIGEFAVAAINTWKPRQWPFWATPDWHLYLAVDDIDAVTERVTVLGGEKMGNTFQLAEAGRGATVVGPTGIVASLWERESHIGAEIRDQHGSMSWAELTTNYPRDAAMFFTGLLGLGFEQDVEQSSDGGRHSVLKSSDRPVAGIAQPARRAGESSTQPYWTVYFGVTDVEAAIASTVDSGGRLLAGPFEVANFSRMAKLGDPAGAVFGVQQLPN